MKSDENSFVELKMSFFLFESEYFASFFSLSLDGKSMSEHWKIFKKFSFFEQGNLLACTIL